MSKISKRSLILRILATAMVLAFVTYYVSGYKASADLNATYAMKFNSIEDVEKLGFERSPIS